MTISNLSIVFGPTLLGAPPHEGGLNLEHMSFQCKVGSIHDPPGRAHLILYEQAIETILEKYAEIFVEDDDGGTAAAPTPTASTSQTTVDRS